MGFTMKTVSNEEHESERTSANVNLNNNTRKKDIQPPQSEIPFNIETEKYSEKGLLLQGRS